MTNVAAIAAGGPIAARLACSLLVLRSVSVLAVVTLLLNGRSVNVFAGVMY